MEVCGVASFKFCCECKTNLEKQKSLNNNQKKKEKCNKGLNFFCGFVVDIKWEEHSRRRSSLGKDGRG
jgi:hypothetical protein